MHNETIRQCCHVACSLHCGETPSGKNRAATTNKNDDRRRSATPCRPRPRAATARRSETPKSDVAHRDPGASRDTHTPAVETTLVGPIQRTPVIVLNVANAPAGRLDAVRRARSSSSFQRHFRRKPIPPARHSPRSGAEFKPLAQFAASMTMDSLSPLQQPPSARSSHCLYLQRQTTARWATSNKEPEITRTSTTSGWTLDHRDGITALISHSDVKPVGGTARAEIGMSRRAPKTYKGGG